MAEEKKIIIDEDWKAQVQAEKEAAAKAQAADKPNDTSGAAAHEFGDVPMPPASLELLLSTLATEALVALGEVAHPATGNARLYPNQAKYLLDTIDMLRQKTKGNLTAQEQQTMESLLHQLRMIFVAKMSESKPATEPAGSA